MKLPDVVPDWNYCQQVPVSAGAMQLRWYDRHNIRSCGNDGELPTLLMLWVAVVREVWCHCRCCLQVHVQMLAREHLEVGSLGTH